MIKIEIDLDKINNYLSNLNPYKKVEWAYETFKEKFSITSSFGAQAAIMAHIIHKVNNKIPILFIDTGYHFSATIAYKDYLQKMFDLNVITIKPELTRIEFEQKYNYTNENNHDFCCKYNKVIPLQNTLKNYACWGTGIRCDQTENRKKSNYLILENSEYKRYKLSPILNYSDNDVELYYKIYDLPEHPLIRKGYSSIGCDCCTNAQNDQNDQRSGRWNGIKKECGIHLITGNGDGI